MVRMKVDVFSYGKRWVSWMSFAGTDLVHRNDGFEAIMEEDDTVRDDPLNHFNKYRGGYNITNKHYWSVSFSPVH